MTTPAKGTILLEVLTQHAENGWVCPFLPGLAKLTGIEMSTVSNYLRRLRQAGKITSRLVHIKPHGQARVVTIVATGKSTGTPQPSTRFNKPADPPFKPTPGALTSAGRILQGEEHAYWKAFYEARDTEGRRKRELA